MSEDINIYAGLGVFAQPGTPPPVNTLFAQLRDIWRRQGHGESYTELARQLGVVPQHASQWASGSDGRKPPWHVIMYLCSVTGHKIVVDDSAWRIVPVKEDDDGNPECVDGQ